MLLEQFQLNLPAAATPPTPDPVPASTGAPFAASPGFIPVYYGSAVPSSPGSYPDVLVPGDGRDVTQDPAYRAYLASLFDSPDVFGRALGTSDDDF
jgi:hypothetical protein